MYSRVKALIPSHRRWLKWSLFAGAVAVALSIDLVTKYVAEQQLVLKETHELCSLLTLQLTHNDGVAFGMLGGSIAVIAVANIVAILLVTVFVLMERRPVFAGIAGGVVVGGSLGNLVQRLSEGYVTDFLKFPRWPNFNAADVFIDVGLAVVVVGVVWEAVKTWRAARHEETEE